MKAYFSILFSLMVLAPSLKANHLHDHIDELRKSVMRAENDEDFAIQWYEKLLQSKPSHGEITYAYLGAAETILAKHSWNPIKKMSLLKSGLDKINYCINLYPHMAEYRIMRFTVEANCPQFVLPTQHLNEDKAWLMKTCLEFKHKPNQKALAAQIENTLIKSGKCTPDELKKISNQ